MPTPSTSSRLESSPSQVKERKKKTHPTHHLQPLDHRLAYAPQHPRRPRRDRRVAALQVLPADLPQHAAQALLEQPLQHCGARARRDGLVRARQGRRLRRVGLLRPGRVGFWLLFRHRWW